MKSQMTWNASAGVVLGIAGVWGLALFSKADWFTDPGPYDEK